MQRTDSLENSDPGKDWRQEEKGTTEDEMVARHHRLDGHEFDQAAEAGDGKGSLLYFSPWGRKELDMTERLNWTGIWHRVWQFKSIRNQQDDGGIMYGTDILILRWLTMVEKQATIGLPHLSITQWHAIKCLSKEFLALNLNQI